jgi:hypothetical protein
LHWLAVAVLAYNTATVFAILPINLLTGLVIPYTRALLSNSVLPETQAQMFAGLSAIESIGTLMSPLFSLGYSLTVSEYGEAMFLVMSALTASSALIMFHIRTHQLIHSETMVYSQYKNDMKEPILSHGDVDDGADASARQPSSSGVAYSRAYSMASNATYGGDRQLTLSVAF